MNRKINTLICIVLALSANNTFGADLSLEQFLNLVQSQNLDLTAEQANVDAAKAKASGIRIDPPMIGLMNMKESSETNQGYEVSQEIPFPTKIYKDKKLRNLEFEAQKESSQYQKLAILSDARVAYFEFWAADKRLTILREKQNWLKNHLKLTRTTTRSDSKAQIHLLGIESSYDMLENEVLSSESILSEKRNNLRLYAPQLDVSEMNSKEPVLVELVRPIASDSTLLAWKRKNLEAMEAKESFSKHSYLPDFFVRYREFKGNSTTPQNQEVMVGITVPFLFFWQPKAQVAEASAERMKAEAEYHKSAVEVDSNLSSLLIKTTSIFKQLKNLNEKLLPRAHRRMKLVENLSQRTMEGLEEHKTVTLDFLDLRVKAIDLRLEYEQSLKEISKLAQSKVGIK
jgi:outer membrane protein TolC